MIRKLVALLLVAGAGLVAHAATDRYLDAQYIRNGTSGTLTLPTSSDVLVGRATTDTLTNKTMSGASNTFSNIPNTATTATSLNTASAIVARDGSGDFSAGTITANLTGNVTGNVSGAVTGNASTATALAANPSDCSASQFATSIDASGNLTCASPAGVGISGSLVTADYTLTSANDVIFGSVVSGTLTLTLPSSSSNSGKVFRIKRIDANGSLFLRIVAAGSDLIDAEGSLIMTQQYQAVELISNGGGYWYVF